MKRYNMNKFTIFAQNLIALFTKLLLITQIKTTYTP